MIVNGVRGYCREYLKLEEMHGSSKKIDAIFYNESRAVIVDWKFSAFSAIDQILMNENTDFIDAIAETKKLFNHQKQVSLMIVPLKRIPIRVKAASEESGNRNAEGGEHEVLLIEFTSEDVERLQREQIHTEIFYTTKYKKMRNSILARAWNVHQKCALGEGRKNHMSVREYLIDIVMRQKPNQIEYYGNYKNCYAVKNPPTNKEQFWALHVLLKEIAAKNPRIISIVDSPPSLHSSVQHVSSSAGKNKVCPFNFYANPTAIGAGGGGMDIDFISMAVHDSLPPLKRFHSANAGSASSSGTADKLVIHGGQYSSMSQSKGAKAENKSVFQYIMDRISSSGWSSSQLLTEEEDDNDEEEVDETVFYAGKKHFKDSLGIRCSP